VGAVLILHRMFGGSIVIYALVIASVMAVPTGAESTGPTPSNLAAYKEAKAGIGRDADAHVRLALWCEARGLDAERTKHLTIATLIDPAHATARGLLGMVQYKGKWLSPDAVAQKIQADPEQQARIHEYLERRVKAADKADDQMRLAAWCAQNELKDQATAHYYRAVQLDPGRELAWKHLGYKKEKGRWVKPEQLAAAREMADLQLKANRHWKPILEKLRSGLSSRSAAEREKAQAALNEIKEPAAVPAIWATFAQANAKHQEVAVRLFGQIDAPGASQALAMLAIGGRSADVRRESVVILKRRDPRDFVGVLIAMIRKPVEYEVRKKVGTASSGELFVKGQDKNWRRIFTPLPIPDFPSFDVVMAPGGPKAIGQLGRDGIAGDFLTYDAQGLPVIQRWFNSDSPLGQALGVPINPIPWKMTLLPADPSRVASGLTQAGLSPKDATKLSDTLVNNAEGNRNIFLSPNSSLGYAAKLDPMGLMGLNPYARLDIPIGQMMRDVQDSAQAAQLQLDNEVKRIEAYNQPIRDTNRQARRILADSTGIDLGDDPTKWQNWYIDVVGLAVPVAASKSQTTTTVEEIPLDYQPRVDPRLANVLALRPYSCFAAGTSVRTSDGSRPIETLVVGDRVLTQSTTTGRIAFSPVLVAYHNLPNETYRIQFEDQGKSIVATGIHRFWKVGRGWAMARDLEPGDTLRAIGGVAKVASIEPDAKQPVFNLRVAEGESFFVGDLGILAHDNSLVNPTDKPFDRAAFQDKTADRN
jgi:hypothetical protein